jgi:glycosyltransferase involved in cell wall biosynthesis
MASVIMTGPVVSVVMPVRDAAATLPAATDSLLAQTEPGWELVAVDDGSTDGSRAGLEGYARRDPRIRVVTAARRGLAAALQAGLSAARAPLIARMDADDVCLPERLARQRWYLDGHPGVDLVACRVRFGGDPARAAGYARHVEWANRLTTHEAIALARFVESPLAHPSVMFRRAVVERLGGYREGDFPEDYELWLRWLEGGARMAKLEDTLLVWNDRPDRLSRRDPRYAAEAFFRVKAEYLARWLAGANAHHPRVVVWGAGRVTRRRARQLEAHGVVIDGWIDVDPLKVGRAVAGAPVSGASALPPPGACFVVSYVGSVGAREEIARILETAGYRPGVDYILAA